MSDEELIDLVSDDENVSDDTTSSDDDPTITPTPISGAYCTRDEVSSLFGDISDDISEEMFITVIDNSTAWVNSNLKRKRVPVPLIIMDNPTGIEVEIQETGLNLTDESDTNTLRTAAIYYAASDILLSLYHGDELPVQYDVWFQKAQEFLNAYIEAYWNSDADEDDLLNHQMVKHSKALTYNQKRSYRGFY